MPTITLTHDAKQFLLETAAVWDHKQKQARDAYYDGVDGAVEAILAAARVKTELMMATKARTRHFSLREERLAEKVAGCW